MRTIVLLSVGCLTKLKVDDACYDWVGEVAKIAVDFAKEIDGVLKKYKNVKFELDGTGLYARLKNLSFKSPPPFSGKAFKGNNKYIYQEIFSVSNATLDGVLGTLDVQLDVIKPLQRKD